jgi:hypothetical protein
MASRTGREASSTGNPMNSTGSHRRCGSGKTIPSVRIPVISNRYVEQAYRGFGLTLPRAGTPLHGCMGPREPAAAGKPAPGHRRRPHLDRPGSRRAPRRRAKNDSAGVLSSLQTRGHHENPPPCRGAMGIAGDCGAYRPASGPRFLSQSGSVNGHSVRTAI